MPTRLETYEQLKSRAEVLANHIKSAEPDSTLDDLVTLSVITIMHASHLYPSWSIAARKLIADKIDSELGIRHD